MRPHHLWVWLLDDWTQAMQRSLLESVPARWLRPLRAQWRIGQAVKAGFLLLPFLILLSFLIPGTPLLRRLLQGWGFYEEAFIALHLVIGARYGVSYGWALHHMRPLLFTGAAAWHDLRVKAALAGGFALFLLASCWQSST